ncbi:MAG TPA: alpha-L-arabinofuranosidase C-terminal domain-containing protein [Terracidiphilus sp.]|nr:alpha-L-arabinofuranosidase C-terminal domain-containing protein [Terracidiphilus sp.]
MRKRFPLLSLLALSLVASVAFSAGLLAQSPSLSIQVDHPTAKVDPMFYGLMTEEINFSYDGGLYAELIRDRVIGPGRRPLFHWTSVALGNSAVNLSVDDTGPSQALTRSIKMAVTVASESAPAGLQNDGYWGIAVRPNTTYTGSFYAKADTAGVPITASLVNDETGATAARATVAGVTTEWNQYTFTLKTGSAQTTANNHFQLTVTRPAMVWFGLVSLFPPTYHNRPNGNRIDIMQKLAAMNPKFLRLPGGNYLEGDHIADRFEWKKTIGPIVDRPTHPSPWRYRSSDGMGLLEFLLWCEELKMEPVLAVYAGYSLMQEHVDPGPALEPYVQDALDEIEYVVGDASTKWGAERVKNGHPAPFPLRYVEIGNEDWFDRSGSYDGRFTQFFKAIEAKYPDLQLIATTAVKSVKPDVLDEHFYMSAEKSFSDWTHHDKYDRSGPKIFVGEWATREGSPTPNLQSALGDAAWLTGLERNSDVVIMECYAPLFVNVSPGGMQWESDLIGYDGLTSYGSPSYWTQVMFAAHTGTEVVSATLNNAGPRIAASVTRDEAQHKLFIKLVNGTSDTQRFQIALDGAPNLKRQATLVTMSGTSPNATNTLTNPDAIKPSEKAIQIAGPKFEYSFVPYSVNVIDISY